MQTIKQSKPVRLSRSGYGTTWAQDFRKHWVLYVIALPALLYFLIYSYFPMAGLAIAFQDFRITRGLFAGGFVGFKHFQNFFNSYYFVRLLRNTLLLSLQALLFGFPVAVLFALLLNEIKNQRFKRAAQTITYLPHFISIVVICGGVIDFTSAKGLINTILGLFGVAPTSFLTQPRWFRTIYVVSDVWQSFGWNSIVFLAALTSVDPQQYEAAHIDGASRLQQIFHISLPGILPTVVTVLLLRIGNLMNLGFEKVLNLYNPAIYETADIISTFVYRQGIVGANYSSAAAIGLFNSLINLILVVLMNAASRKLTQNGLW
jgi:putative aldouronate transport system permease protein